MIDIAPGQPEDLPAIERICAQAFADFGDYAQLVTKFYSTQGVHSFVARQRGQPVGFVLLGFLPWTGGDPDDERDWWLGDVLAIAVDADLRRHGVGRALMERALDLVSEMAEWRDLKEVQLICPAEDVGAQAFFERFGFAVADREQGSYSSGQAAWRLVRPMG